jgi:hypothetical protein
MECLIFLVEKHDGRVNAHACANGSIQHDYINKEDTTSPRATSESILLAASIDAKEHHHIISAKNREDFGQSKCCSCKSSKRGKVHD